MHTPVASLNDPAKQDTIAGVSSDGKTVLWQRGMCNGGVLLQLLIGDSNGIGYTITDLTNQVSLAQLAVDEEGTVTLTSDGLAIIGMSDDHRTFLQATRPAIGNPNFGNVTNVDFAALNVDASKRIHFPVISSDRLAFYFRMDDTSNPSNSGLYETVRSSTTVPFPAAKKLPALVQAYELVTGVSSDRLTLFLQYNMIQTAVLTRQSLTDPFSNPNAPGSAPLIPGFRIRPLGDCQSLLGTYTPNGCVAQEIEVFTK